MHQSDTRKAHK